MKKNIILVLLFFSTIAHAEQFDSIKLVDITADSLVFVVHIMHYGVDDCVIEYIPEDNNIKVNILYTQIDRTDCYCSFQETIKIKKDTYIKLVVEVMFRYFVGWIEEDKPELSSYISIGIKEIDLSNITSIDNSLILSKIAIFPNPVQNVLHVNLGENKTGNLEVYDLQGNLMLCKNIASEKGIDVSFLSSGLYFVLIDGRYISHIVKK